MGRQELPEQIAFPGTPVARRASAAAARQTTERYPAQRLTWERQDPPAHPHHIGHHSGIYPEDAPATSTAVRHRPHQRTPALYEDKEAGEYDDAPRSPTSAVRYTTPSRMTRVMNQPLPTRRLRRSRLPGRLLLGVGVLLIIMMAGWFSLSAFTFWWQIHQDDTTYGRPRTYQVDAVVGHNGDDAQHPSHFIAMNLKRHVIVIELPAGDPGKAVIYSAGTLLGDGQDLTPVTLTFEDRNGDGKPDLNIHIGDQVVVFLNTGQQFVTAQQH